jgi:ABC-type lipoprotein release transport system permease subunit
LPTTPPTRVVCLSRTLAGLLYEVPPADVGALGVVAALLAGVGLAAVLIPAYRATRVNAVDVLRAE